MYIKLRYIIENINENIIVFDYFLWFGVVVVIECGGYYCFLYIGYFLELGILLKGICIDILLNIIVCDIRFKIV